MLITSTLAYISFFFIFELSIAYQLVFFQQLKALKTIVYILLEGNKEDKEERQEESSYKAKEEDINKDKDKKLISSIAIYYTCIKALLSKLVNKLIK